MTNIEALQKQLSQDSIKINTLKSNIEINKIVEKNIINATCAQYASIWMYNGYSLVREREHDEVREIPLNVKEGLLYKCFATKKTKIYNNLKSEKGYRVEIDNPDNIKIKSKILIPLTMGDKFVGIVTAYSSIKQVKNFTKADLEVFRAITPFIIDAIYKMHSNRNNRTFLADRRSNIGLDNGNRRRHSDSICNLDNLKIMRSQTKTPQEILEAISNIVHDIRTPSNGLFGFLEILEEQVSDVRLKEYVAHAKHSASLINKLTTSILDGVSVERDLFESDVESINPFSFFSKIAGMFSAAIYKKSINYNVFIDPLLPREIEIHSIQLKRIIMNLIGNAIKFTPEHGSIEFSVRYKQKEQMLHIFVKDNGIGIAKQKQEKIFEAFEQASDNTKELFGGTGLGLSISANSVKELGGKLLLKSKVDEGSIFYFDIPIKTRDNVARFKPIENKDIKIAILINKKNHQVASNILINFIKFGIDVKNIYIVTNMKQIDKDTTHLVVFERKLTDNTFLYSDKNKMKLLVVEEKFLSLNTKDLHGVPIISQYNYFGETLYSFVSEKKTPKVLIVEDDDISIILLKAMLQDEDCDIDIANNGEEGLMLLQRALQDNNPYSVVYTDKNMPILSGDKMLEKYRALEQEKGVKKLSAVCISGNIATDKDSLHCFDFFAIKPFKKQEILSIFFKSIDTKY